MRARTRDVSAVSIDQFCADRGLTPQVIKIDVEGAELAVLRGARATIAAAGPGLQLFVEMHPHLWTERGIAAEDVRASAKRSTSWPNGSTALATRHSGRPKASACGCVPP